MSLNPKETKDTIKELQANFDLTGLSISEVANDLDTSEVVIQNLLRLETSRIENPWILRNYLLTKLDEMSIKPVPFSRLVGNASDYWFLNAIRVRKGKIS